METLQVQSLKLSEIHADPNNPRKDYPKESLKELAASMQAFGVQQPLKVRPSAKGKGYTVVFGHRRQRGAELAGLTEVPCFVEEMDDLKAAKLQLTENIAREDLAPLEIAGSLKRQMDLGVTIEQLEADTGWKKTTLYTHMQLMKLGPEGRKALGEELISKSVAMELATVPEALQGKCLKRLVDRGVPTVAFARSVIHEQFRSALAHAHFDPKDAKLCPKAGACTNCTKRTGANMDLFATSKSPDVCTDLVCFDEKEAAWLAQQQKAGRAVLSEAQTKEAFRGSYGQGDEPGYNSGYVKADEQQWEHSNKKARALVDPDRVLLAKAPNGVVVELVRKIDLPERRERHEPDRIPGVKSAQEVKGDRARELTARTAAVAMAQLLDTKAVKELETRALRVMALAMTKTIHSESLKKLAKKHALDEKDGFGQAIWGHAYGLQGAELRQFVFELAFAQAVEPGWYRSEIDEALEEACKMLGVNAASAEKSAEKELKPSWEAQDERRNAKKKAFKKAQAPAKPKKDMAPAKKAPAKKPATAAKAKAAPKKKAKAGKKAA